MTFSYNDIKESLVALAKIRADKRNYDTKIMEVKRQWEEKYADVLAELDNAVTTLEDARHSIEQLEKVAEENLRAASVDYFKESNSRSLPDGIEIAIYKKYEYDDAQALAWAIEHKQCLSLDKKAFGDLAKSSKLRPAFVVEVEEPGTKLFRNKIDDYLSQENTDVV